MDKILLDIVTPERAIAKNVEADAVVLPGADGQLQILPGHVNLLTSLRLGSFAYLEKGNWKWAALNGGFAQVVAGRLRVLADTVEQAHEIDVARAELAKNNAIEKLKNLKPGTKEYNEASAAKERAETRLSLAERHNR